MQKEIKMSETDQNEADEFTLSDICKSSGLTVVQVTEYIQEGLFEVSGDDSQVWRFSQIHLVMVQKVSRLEQDLRLNPAGAVLAMEMMAEIEDLKQRLCRTAAEND